jgi:hypothetical protein
MPYGYGYGRGYGFRGSSPPWPYVGRGRGGLPRGWYPAAFPEYQYAPGPAPYPNYAGWWGGPPYWEPADPTAMGYGPAMTREAELEFLKEEANALKSQLENIEARVKDLESD